MKIVKCIKDVQNFTKGKTYQAKSYDYGMYSIKGDNGKYFVAAVGNFSDEK